MSSLFVWFPLGFLLWFMLFKNVLLNFQAIKNSLVILLCYWFRSQDSARESTRNNFSPFNYIMTCFVAQLMVNFGKYSHSTWKKRVKFAIVGNNAPYMSGRSSIFLVFFRPTLSLLNFSSTVVLLAFERDILKPPTMMVNMSISPFSISVNFAL